MSDKSSEKHEKKPAKPGKEPKQDLKDVKIAELTNTLQRLQAEFENYRKRCERESADYKQFATKGVIVNILPILDSFELALKNKDADDEFTQGVELVYAQLFSALEQEGLKKIDAIGKKFDPMMHEALMTEEGKEDDVIVEELQKGYLLNDAVLRSAKVKISKKKN